ncbi:hypothetical protein EAX61_10695 [Dokdonia sinensis]|uniref:Fibronectin type-III domain-containing protein n=1 Tax=Dokdonia sinensis TaxID=2479847 RepID=A0A3M0G918_9FLAO|nr:T9SS type B sorting domain-containing protein [Dokdonia sinensis]RMB57579.1 hypothetical protein EAX61_10695 [Dokdonia sinensis]
MFWTYCLGFFFLLGNCSNYAFAKAESPQIKAFETLKSDNSSIQQPCSALIVPAAGATNVPVESIITWDPTQGNFGYIITLGTTPGGNEIVSSTGVGSNSFRPPLGLPENTTIYVNIEVRDSSSTSIACNEQEFTTGAITQLSECTSLSIPSDGEVDVAVALTLVWTYAPRATNYIVQLGTTPGGTDVLDVDTNSNELQYTIPFNLDFGTTYYARVIPENSVGERGDCSETTFTTVFLDDDVPDCTQLINPADGAEGVALTPLLSWLPVATADGYLLRIGTSPGAGDVLNNEDLGDRTSTLVLDFDEGVTYYVTVTPYNLAGEARNCLTTSFTTVLGCGPYINEFGNTIDLNPIIDLEDSYILCLNESPLRLNHSGEGTSFRWLFLEGTSEREISTSRDVAIDQGGLYRLEVVNEIIIPSGGSLMCESSHEFEVTTSEAAIITGLDIRNQGFNFKLTVTAEGSSDYEYALDVDGPYQDSNVFNNVNITDVMVYVRDKNGCRITSKRIVRDRGFPKYFTPNGDGINDYWQVRGVRVDGEIVTNIQIFDRFGKKITEFSSRSMGWDGSYGGNMLLDSGFWYKAFTESNVIFTGYFALRR